MYRIVIATHVITNIVIQCMVVDICFWADDNPQKRVLYSIICLAAIVIDFSVSVLFMRSVKKRFGCYEVIRIQIIDWPLAIIGYIFIIYVGIRDYTGTFFTAAAELFLLTERVFFMFVYSTAKDSNVNIDAIMDMIDWNNTHSVQEKGRELAKNIQCINVFIQPELQKYNRNVWENCAIILSERSDQELQPYVNQLFKWLMDMNWPGAMVIYDRLKRYEKNNSFKDALEECAREATLHDRYNWLSILQDFY